MKIVKIKFVDFWEHWNQEDNFIVNTLKKYFKVEFSENPDYVFYLSLIHILLSAERHQAVAGKLR